LLTRRKWVENEQPLSEAISVGEQVSGWVPASTINQHLITFGDMDLTIGQFDFGGDWP